MAAQDSRVDKAAQWAGRGAGPGTKPAGERAAAPAVAARLVPLLGSESTSRSGERRDRVWRSTATGLPRAVGRICTQTWTGFVKKTPVGPHLLFIGARTALPLTLCRSEKALTRLSH